MSAPATPTGMPTRMAPAPVPVIAGAFLHTLGQALAAMTLYGAGHPARSAAHDRALAKLRELLARVTPLRLTFVGGDVIVDRLVLHEFREWDWGARLAAGGVQRVEFGSATLAESEFVELLTALHAAVGTGCPPLAHPQLVGSIRFGPVGLAGSESRTVSTPAMGEATVPLPAEIGALPVAIEAAHTLLSPEDVRDELDALAWVEAQTAETNRLPVGEAETIVRGLSLAMRADHGSFLPLIELKSTDQYTTVHSCNVAMLAMGLAEQLAFGARDVRAIGVAALLHDIGKVRLPDSLLNKTEALTAADRALLNTHSLEGARLLGERGAGYGLAAIVAYEHHIGANGQGGYPKYTFPRQPHYVSRLVQVCDIYDALSTDRPYRAAWPRVRALHHMRLRAGREIDADLLLAFFDLLDQYRTRSPRSR
ncbi:HD domain-containing phosphohydrolase [Gemmatimonas sp.]|jgi:putative nucleotidyltransferase with HDIG domain|uniref:HD-GYP domain-containing protein n=3 Tax=Gemmatimonas sp. TaxID=1962908 RepID=UPI0022BD860B|nr:HD domain-containing phosphohydrolase [Gemmatimonas sp.]MCA2984263.1 HD domain-containing protein [Gemmatimonas sp.]MCA2986384.1 HD domain-containing protein [Gemmatimonas sp.]MCA2990777.1 HD domain-containing protein [Gemmatimonas sp.]MCA2995012.1 HD domain-containing protein [Gemmatimonas sp.]MCE2955006.1 HD domain-containing protein [Gemmatimonas sp.]